MVEANVRAVRAGLAQLVDQGSARPIVLFSTHSLPTMAAATAGPDGGDGYTAAHRFVAEEVIAALGGTSDDGDPIAWRLVYQSRSGSPSVPWLEPDILAALAEVAALHRDNRPDGVLVVPLGFLTDHVAVSYTHLDVYKRQVPAFMTGAPAQDWLVVYPFVRSYEWYLLPEQERRDMLIEHGPICPLYTSRCV